MTPTTQTISAGQALIDQITELTRSGKLPWNIVKGAERKKKWQLSDASNVIATRRNGIGLRFCQGERGGYFLHLLNRYKDPVRLTCDTEAGEKLLREIGKTVPALGRVLAFLDEWGSTPPPKPNWFQRIIQHIPKCQKPPFGSTSPAG